ncbi:MAG: hypothetical protein ACK5DJ_04420 [Bacteroidota bacterium]
MVVVIAGAGVFSKDFCIKASLFIVAVAFVLADTSPVLVQKSAGVFSPGTDKVDSAVKFCGSEYHFHDANETTENIVRNSAHDIFFFCLAMLTSTLVRVDMILLVVLVLFLAFCSF